MKVEAVESDRQSVEGSRPPWSLIVKTLPGSCVGVEDDSLLPPLLLSHVTDLAKAIRVESRHKSLVRTKN